MGVGELIGHEQAVAQVIDEIARYFDQTLRLSAGLLPAVLFFGVGEVGAVAGLVGSLGQKPEVLNARNWGYKKKPKIV